jgi:hypothetical protein
MTAAPRGLRASLKLIAAGKTVAALALAAVLAACGSAAAPGSAAGPSAAGSGSPSPPSSGPGPSAGAAARGALCADPGAVTKAVIAGNAGAQMRPLRQLPPRFATLAQGAPARALARAVCVLPLMPKGTVNCPMQQLGRYTLRFWAGLRQLPEVRAIPTGCTTVTGAGPVRRAPLASPFWLVLAATASHRLPVADGTPVSS